MAEKVAKADITDEKAVPVTESIPNNEMKTNLSRKRPPNDSQSKNSPTKKLRLELPKVLQNGHPNRNGVQNKSKFIYGNYNRYYGYRCEKNVEDVRLIALSRYELFNDREILDIGCNDGSLTVALAKRLSINFITGIDIDANLIAKARKNVTYETQAILNNNDKTIAHQTKFPNNIAFKQLNYVLANDGLLDLEEPRYDTILCLSVSKWIHLNFGDDGLKRAFKRMYKQLKDGGTLVLETQDWKSYKRRKTLTPEINAHYKQIQLFPKLFHDYLLSSEIGFESSYQIELPQEHSANGFKRPIIAYKKGKSQTQAMNIE